MRKDRTVLIFTSSITIGVLSILLPLFSVHTYCENRYIAGVYGVVALALFILSLKNAAIAVGKSVLSGTGESACVVAIIVNLTFIIYSTHTCRHMFDQLKN